MAKIFTNVELNDLLWDTMPPNKLTWNRANVIKRSHERLRFLLSALYRCKNGECWLSDDVMAEIEQAVKE